MITVKDYIKPIVRNILTTIRDVALKLGIIIATSVIFLLIFYFLRWWSIIPIGLIGLVWYIYHEAYIAYVVDKDMKQERIDQELGSLMRIPVELHDYNKEDKIEYYEGLTRVVIYKMEEYEKLYGQDEFFKDRTQHWEAAREYVKHHFTEGTF